MPGCDFNTLLPYFKSMKHFQDLNNILYIKDNILSLHLNHCAFGLVLRTDIFVHIYFSVWTCALVPMTEISKHHLFDTISNMAQSKGHAQMAPFDVVA